MKDDIEAKNFFQDDGDKIKINWFCYEYANNLYNAIKAEKNSCDIEGSKHLPR